MNLFFIYKSDSVNIVIVPVHHCALDIQFVIISHCKINLCHSCKHCNQYNGASFSCILDCLSHCDVISCTIINHIGFVWSECFQHCFTEIFFFCIHTDINATFFRLIQTEITDIRDHNFCCSHSLCYLCHKITNRTGTKHGNVHSFHITNLLYSVNCNSQWLDHCTFFI